MLNFFWRDLSSDSTPSSPKQSSSELLASETSDVVDEFLPTEGWFGADINDEISNDLYSEVHIDIKPDKETMNSSKKKNNRKRPVCSQDDLSASDYKIDSTVNKKKQKDFWRDYSQSLQRFKDQVYVV